MAHWRFFRYQVKTQKINLNYLSWIIEIRCMRRVIPGWDSRIRATVCLNADLTNIELEFNRISNCNHWKYQSLLSSKFVSAYCFVVHGRHGSITMQALTSKHGHQAFGK